MLFFTVNHKSTFPKYVWHSVLSLQALNNALLPQPRAQNTTHTKESSHVSPNTYKSPVSLICKAQEAMPFFQCLKCLTPVTTRATPYLLQQSMASWSRTLPPGWAMAATPAWQAFSTESFHEKGKKASLASADPCGSTSFSVQAMRGCAAHFVTCEFPRYRHKHLVKAGRLPPTPLLGPKSTFDFRMSDVCTSVRDALLRV